MVRVGEARVGSWIQLEKLRMRLAKGKSNQKQRIMSGQNGSGLVKQALLLNALTLFMLTELLYSLWSKRASLVQEENQNRSCKKTAKHICTCKHVFAHERNCVNVWIV